MNKLYLIFLLIFSISSCQDKNKTNGKIINMTNDMKEKFDIVKYNKEIESKEKLNDPNLSLSDYEEKKADGTRIEYRASIKNGEEFYGKLIYPSPPALYFDAYEYDEKGNFMSKDTWFFGSYLGYDDIKAGKSFYANNNNTVTEVDEDKKYDDIKIKPNKLFEILQREPLFVSISEEDKKHFGEIFLTNSKDITIEKLCKLYQRQFLYEPQTAAGRENIAVRLENNKIWFVMKDLYPLGQIFLKIDANTGKISNREYHRETRP
jgi:hypothetical protein